MLGKYFIFITQRSSILFSGIKLSNSIGNIGQSDSILLLEPKLKN